MDDNSGKLDLDYEEYEAGGDPEKEKMMKMHEQDVQEFLEEYDDSDDGLDEQEYKQKYEKDLLTGIGGWLVLMLIGICLTIILMMFTVLAVLLIPNSLVSSALLVMFLPILLIYIFLIVIMTKKLWFFPRMYQITNLAYLIILIATLFIGKPDFMMLLSIVSAIIWIIYLQMSKRVKNTFIYRWSGEVYEKAAAKTSEV